MHRQKADPPSSSVNATMVALNSSKSLATPGLGDVGTFEVEDENTAISANLSRDPRRAEIVEDNLSLAKSTGARGNRVVKVNGVGYSAFKQIVKLE